MHINFCFCSALTCLTRFLTLLLLLHYSRSFAHDCNISVSSTQPQNQPLHRVAVAYIACALLPACSFPTKPHHNTTKTTPHVSELPQLREQFNSLLFSFSSSTPWSRLRSPSAPWLVAQVVEIIMSSVASIATHITHAVPQTPRLLCCPKLPPYNHRCPHHLEHNVATHRSPFQNKRWTG